MTADDIAVSSPISRKFLFLGSGIVVAIALYSGAWFFAAQEIDSRVTAFLREPGIDGVSGECRNTEVRGYPFRIGLFCDTVAIDDTRHGISASFGALRSAAQVYDPGHAIVELEAPSEIRVSPGLSLFADWQLLKASFRAGFSGLHRTSIVYDGLDGTLLPASSGERIGFKATHGEVHLRQNEADLDAAASAEAFALMLGEDKRALPSVNAALDLRLTGKAGLLAGEPVTMAALRGSAGDIRTLTVAGPDGMTASATGPFTIDTDGLISGELSVTVQNITGWRDAIMAADPNSAEVAANVSNMLTALADGDDEATVKLNIRNGTAFLAFIPLGVLPQF